MLGFILQPNYPKNSTHDLDLVCNPQTRSLHYPNIQLKPFQLLPQLENLSRSIDRLSEDDMVEVDRVKENEV
jgi:hypothetical protein